MKVGLLLIAAAAALPAQHAIEGEVVDSVTGAPLAATRVAQGVAREIAIADAAGHFHLPIPDTQTVVQLNRPGYLPRYPSYMSGHNTGSVLFQMTPQAVIGGKIEDEDGFPLQGATVTAYHYASRYGRRQLYNAGRTVLTNESGEYRIFNLPAGSYYIRVLPNRAEVEWDARYGPQFYPDATDAGHGTALECTAGQERRGIDIRLTRKEGVTVSGRYTVPQGGARPRITLQSVDEPIFPDPYVLEAGARSANGEFVFTHVPPGTYSLGVPHQGFDGPKAGELSAAQQIEVGSTDVRELALDVHPLEPMELTGKVVFPASVAPGPVTVELSTSAPLNRIAAISQSDGSFVLKGVFPGRYDIWASNGGTRSIRFADREVMHSGFELGTRIPGPLEITMGEPVTGKLSANVVDSAGRGVAGVLVLWWPVGGDRLLRTYSDSDGAIILDSAPAGDYHVYLPQERGGYFDDPDYRKAHANDFPLVHLAAGNNPPVTLRLKSQ
jgi:hypothetical protein